MRKINFSVAPLEQFLEEAQAVFVVDDRFCYPYRSSKRVILPLPTDWRSKYPEELGWPTELVEQARKSVLAYVKEKRPLFDRKNRFGILLQYAPLIRVSVQLNLLKWMSPKVVSRNFLQISERRQKEIVRKYAAQLVEFAERYALEELQLRIVELTI